MPRTFRDNNDIHLRTLRGRDTVVVNRRSHKFQSLPTGAGGVGRGTRSPHTKTCGRIQRLVGAAVSLACGTIYRRRARFYLHRVTARTRVRPASRVRRRRRRPRHERSSYTYTRDPTTTYKRAARFQCLLFIRIVAGDGATAPVPQRVFRNFFSLSTRPRTRKRVLVR